MILPPGYILFSGTQDDAMIKQARAFCHEHGLTADDIKITKDGSTVSVQAKRDISWLKQNRTSSPAAG